MRGRARAAFGRLLVLCMLTAAPVLVGSAPAEAVVCVRLSTSPVRPVVGRPVNVELRTLTPTSTTTSGYRLEPRSVPATYPFHVTAETVDQIVLIHVERSADPMVWAGQFVLSKAGAWNLRVGNLDRARSLDPRCYSPLPLTVASAGRAGQAALGRSSLGPTLLLAVAVLAVLVGTTLFVVIRTRARPPGPS